MYLYALSWLYPQPCCLPRQIKAGRKGAFFLRGLAACSVRDIHHRLQSVATFTCQMFLTLSLGSPAGGGCAWILELSWDLDAVQWFWFSVITSDRHFMSVFLLTSEVLCFLIHSVFLAVTRDHSKHQTTRRRHLLLLLMTWTFSCRLLCSI